MKKLVQFVFFFGCVWSAQAQIMIGESSDKVETIPNTNTLYLPAETLNNVSTTSIYFVSNLTRSFRLLEPNSTFLADSLGARAQERTLNTWSFGVGVKNKISNHFFWDGGVSLLKNGESYAFSQSDTSYFYQTNYSYFAMPFRLNFTTGKTVQFYMGAGVIPQIFTKYRQDRQWTTSTNSRGQETIKSKSGYNSFAISAVLNVGILLRLDNQWSLLVSPEARWQLNSTYTKQDGLVHKARGYGITFGLVKNLTD